jgi:FkbM family methyltransferase
MLTENVRRNGRNNVTCLNVALSAQNGSCSITNGREPATNRIISEGENEASIRVKSRTLRSICVEHAALPEFVKIDVEGHESSVLEGFEDLSLYAKMICIEGGERQIVREWMRNVGYSGPWYVHYKQRLLTSMATSRPEDPGFLGRAFAAELSTIGFGIN